MTAIRSTEEKVRSEPTLRSLVEQEALEANRATPFLNDDTVSEALSLAGKFLRQARASVLAANCADCELAADKVDAGTLDRLRLNPARIDAIAAQTELTAAMAPLERDVESWILPNGLRVTERRIPIGTVGANFEARPNVAVDVAAQLLKSLNTVVLRTGGAALRTVTVLVDEILRPALEATGIPGGAVGLVRSADHDGPRALVSLPRRIPLVILRGSGKTTAALGRLAAENGVRTLAHAQGGGVLYVHEAAAPDRALAIAEASLDRLGVCNRLNLLLVDLGATSLLPKLMALLAEKGIAVRGTSRVSEHVTVANMGPMPGQEVVQLYVRDIDSSVSRPVRELTGFVKVGLEPAESKRVSMNFSAVVEAALAAVSAH